MTPPALARFVSGETATVHASCVALSGRALLIVGASGSGKSALALDLMAFGAGLVSDDRVALRRTASCVIADTVPAISGLVEARGLGLLHAPVHGPASVAWVLDLDQEEPQRLPPFREIRLLGHSVPLLLRPRIPHLGPSLAQLLKSGRATPDGMDR
ncbi:HPr kinase/phosphorylase [Ruegeria sp. PrR005]|uniref:Serine kinase n=1 Tax=Ruegeria sp. PrR005 TaxID=2706882 RepID=A0A6B2NQ55_9RHOB|nr:serine kinase [Ruegeria sp. PrR005]NDW46271.1 serine kinase [Ruegeria sp. PrR005]